MRSHLNVLVTSHQPGLAAVPQVPPSREARIRVGVPAQAEGSERALRIPLEGPCVCTIGRGTLRTLRVTVGDLDRLYNYRAAAAGQDVSRRRAPGPLA